MKLKPAIAKLAVTTLLASVLSVIPTTVLAAPSTNADWHPVASKTTICHRTHAVTNPYRRITVSDSAVYGTSGHNNPNHDRDYTVNGVTYHVFDSTVSYPSNSKFWGDIIPPQDPTRISGSATPAEASGVNWIVAGIAIYDGDVSGCRTMTDREFIASEVEGGATSQEISQDLNDQDPDGTRWTSNAVNTIISEIQTVTAQLSLVNDVRTTDVNTTLNSNSETNDTKPAGSTYTKQSNPSHGSVTMTSSGGFTYIPTTNYSGSDSFTYKTCLPSPNTTVCKIANVTINIAAAGQPVAADDENATIVNTSVTSSVSGNDTAPSGSTFDLVTFDSSQGSLSLSSTSGAFTFLPATNRVTNATFTYKVCLQAPSTTCSTIATSTILIIRTQNDAETTPFNTAITASVTANDTSNLTYTTTLISSASSGTAVLQSNGTYTYTPNNNFSGTDNFTYRACHTSYSSVCHNSVVTITISPAVVYVAPSPVVEPPSIQVNNDKGKTKANKSLQATVIDNDKSGLNNKKVTEPKNGVVELKADGTFVYVPKPDFVGKDSYVYQACDATGLCSSAVVEILVSPDAENDKSNAKRNTPLDSTVTLNDTKALSYVKLQDPSNGKVTLKLDGSYTYTPNSGFVGKDKFTYRACDPTDSTNCVEAEVEIDITPPSLQVPNVAKVTKINDPIIATIAKEPNSGLLYSKQDSPKNGNVEVNPDGTFNYVPNPNFVGQDVFTVRAYDPFDPTLFTVASVIVRVLPRIEIQAVDDTYQMKLGQRSITLNPLKADSGISIKLSTFAKKSASGGSVYKSKSGKLIYSPKAGFFGMDTLKYTIIDMYGFKASATEIIFVPKGK